MTHSVACQIVKKLREEKGEWKYNGKSWTWVPAPECNYLAVQLRGEDYSIELAR